jgi:acyl-ACP thioesterase
MAENVWNEPVRIRVCDIDPWRRATVQALCGFLADVASNHAWDLGLHIDQENLRGMTWVLGQLEIHVERYPLWGESIRIETWLSHAHSFHLFRDYRILNANNDQTLAHAASLWLLLDFATRRPTRIPDYMLEKLVQEKKRLVPEPHRSLYRPKEAMFQRTFHVCLSDLDLNHHVNHLRYIEWAIDTLPYETWQAYGMEEMGAIFLAETIHGDTIISQSERTHQDSREVFTHRLIRERNGREVFLGRTVWRRDEEKMK